jgi:hypothetical protein
VNGVTLRKGKCVVDLKIEERFLYLFVVRLQAYQAR